MSFIARKSRLMVSLINSAVTRNEKIIFLHIPKTAGTSLREIVEREYGRERCLFLYYPDYDDATVQEIRMQMPKVKVLYGHVSYPIHELFNVKAKYVAFLRDPIERVISFYKHSACDPESPHYESIKSGMSLYDMLQQEVTIQTNNHMTRMLSNCWQADELENTQLVDKALENIQKHFYYVGLMEEFSASIKQLGKKLHWKTNYEIPFVNVSIYEQKIDVDSKTRDLLERYNYLDMMLYERIKKILFI